MIGETELTRWNDFQQGESSGNMRQIYALLRQSSPPTRSRNTMIPSASSIARSGETVSTTDIGSKTSTYPTCIPDFLKKATALFPGPSLAC